MYTRIRFPRVKKPAAVLRACVLPNKLVLRRGIFRKVLVIVGIVRCFVRIANRQALGTRLAIDVIVRAAVDIEVAHFMDDGAGARIGTRVCGAPERIAQIDAIRLSWIHVSKITVGAAAVIDHALITQGAVDARIVRFHRIEATRGASAKPSLVAGGYRAGGLAGEIVHRVAGIGLGAVVCSGE